MTPTQELIRMLDLAHPPVAVALHEQEPAEQSRRRPAPEPAGCCFWAQAEHHRLHTTATDHAHCSVGSYTHGLISLADAAAGDDTAALVGRIAVSPGCAVSRVRTGLPANELTCALPARELADIVGRLKRSLAADAAVSAYADADLHQNFTPA